MLNDHRRPAAAIQYLAPIFDRANLTSWYDMIMNEVTYTVHIEPAEEGGFVASFPALPGCQPQGETFEEVIAMAKDALVGFLETLRRHAIAQRHDEFFKAYYAKKQLKEKGTPSSTG